jgi:predicted lactoylglutathione lyase
MIGYVTLGTNDLAAATAFYDKLFAAMGEKRVWESDRAVAWGTSMQAPSLGVIKPFDGKPAAAGNGNMVALVVGSKADVDRYYALAIELGATDEGKPGQRGDGFYAAYFRDPEGHKLNLFHMG